MFKATSTKVSTHGLLSVYNPAQAGEAVLLLERVNQYDEMR
jgi:hypothetical protein